MELFCECGEQLKYQNTQYTSVYYVKHCPICICRAKKQVPWFERIVLLGFGAVIMGIVTLLWVM